MNAEEFVQTIKLVVEESAISGTLENAKNPPGRSISIFQRDRAEWLQSLSPEHGQYLASMVAEASRSAVFGMLCVLDGVRAVAPGTDRGRFELRYMDRHGETLLTEFILHEMY